MLAASCFFYANYVPAYIFILFFLITLDYRLALIIESSPRNKKKSWLVLSIGANVLTLLVFKYFDFFTGNTILLPIGLSFHTMQSMSYIIEVFREKQKTERNFLTYALYVMFFPQLVAGPIERPQNLLRQFYEVHEFDIKRALSGFQLILFGFYKKVVIADYLSTLVDHVYRNPTQSSGTDFVIASVTFSMQIYCDFSGYSDIARGTARVIGFELHQNFDHPFGASNLAELWKRWHITLTNWFRDYVYIPLGGSKKSSSTTFLNIMLVFLLSGLWHGAGWTFLAWAALNGLMVAFLHLFAGRFKLKSRAFGILLTYLYFSFTIIFFRSPSIGSALFIVSRLFSGGALNMASFNIALAVALIASLEIIHFAQRNFQIIKVWFSQKIWQKWLAYYVSAVILIVLTYLSVANQNNLDQPFIYFQF